MTGKKQLDEKIQTGGGATGVAHTADPTGGKATLPASHSNSESMKKIDTSVTPGQGEEETSTENNVKVVGNDAAKNKASVAMKEDIDAMFNGEELSETFREKATVIFEAAVNARVEEVTADLEEQFNTRLEEEVASIEEAIQNKLDDYLTYVAEQWMEENRVAVEQSLRTEITESFIEGIRGLFEQHYINVPQDRFDVVEDLQGQLEEMQAKLDEAIEDNITLANLISEASASKILAQVAEGLTATQAEKLATLAEGVTFDTVDEYKRKLEIVKENYFPSTTSTKAQNLMEQLDESAPASSTVPTNSTVAQYASAISRTVKK